MRLTKNEIKILKENLKILSNEAKIYLFGSRIDEAKKGGDIDLLILSDKLTKKDLRRIRVEFFKRFGEQKMDIVLDKLTPQKIFTKLILPKAIEL